MAAVRCAGGQSQTAGKSIRDLGNMARLQSSYTGDNSYLLIASAAKCGFVLWLNPMVIACVRCR